MATEVETAGRWSAERVLALAPDPGAALAARRLATPAPWSASGAAPEVVWGDCAGSGGAPYQVAVDLTGPAYRCSCPSRKIPCKHALALLLRWAAGELPDQPPAEHAAGWLEQRRARAARTARRGTGDPAAVAAAAARAAQRTDRVAAGLAELETWLRDQVRAGLSGLSAGYRHTEQVAARMVDAQAPGVAARLRGLGALPASGDGWPERLLAGYAQLHLLARAHARLDALPAEFAATVRGHVGYPVRREDVLAAADPAGCPDEWTVLGVRELSDGTVPARRGWLRGARTGRFALLLDFDPLGDFGPPLLPGSALTGKLHFYPGRPPVRAVLGEHQVAAAAPPPPARNLAAQRDEWAAALELDPWLAEWPAVLRGVPVPGDGWWLVAAGEAGAGEAGAGTTEAAGAGAVRLLTGGVDPWVLAAVSGGAAVTVAGEWSPDGLRPLTVWHGERAVPL